MVLIINELKLTGLKFFSRVECEKAIFSTFLTLGKPAGFQSYRAGWPTAAIGLKPQSRLYHSLFATG